MLSILVPLAAALPFQTATAFPAPLHRVPGVPLKGDFAAADLDRDGRVDVVLVAGPGSSAPGLYVALGRGPESFAPAAFYPTSAVPRGVAVADLDGAAGLDLIVARSPGYSVLLEQGDGTYAEAFQSSVPFSVATSIAVGDVDGDGLLDLFLSSDSSGPTLVHLAYGLGQGQFMPALTIGFGPALRKGNLADVDGDSLLDLVVLSTTSGVARIAVRKNLGNRNFSLPLVQSVTLPFAGELSLGDFDGDGILDAAVTTAFDAAGTKTVAIQLGLGNGSFGNPTGYDFGEYARHPTVLDFDGDSLLDVLLWVGDGYLGTFTESRLVLLRGTGGGALQVESGAGGLGDVTGLATGDLDRDGRLEALVCLQTVFGESDFTTLFSRPGRAPHLGRELDTGFLFGALGAGDFDDDGRGDLLLGRDGTIEVLHGSPHDRFTSVQALANPNNWYATKMFVEDLNGNQREDLIALLRSAATPEGAIEVYNGRPNGTFERLPAFPGNAPAVAMALGDLDGDLRKDLLVASAVEPYLRYHLHPPGAPFGAGVPIRLESYSFAIALGDLDGDGLDDVVAGIPGAILILPNLGSGGFARPLAVSAVLGQTVVADANDDGWLDLIGTTNVGNQTVLRILPGRGDFTFDAPISLDSMSSPGPRFVVDDVDGDGLTDVAVAGGALDLFRGLGLSQFAPPQRTWCGGGLFPPLFSDMDGDGRKDLVVHGYYAELARVVAQR